MVRITSRFEKRTFKEKKKLTKRECPACGLDCANLPCKLCGSCHYCEDPHIEER